MRKKNIVVVRNGVKRINEISDDCRVYFIPPNYLLCGVNIDLIVMCTSDYDNEWYEQCLMHALSMGGQIEKVY